MMHRGTLVALLSATLGIALTTSLGVWQLRRAATKIALQQQWQNTLAQPPEWVTRHGLDGIAQRAPVRVRVRGTWQPKATVWLNNRALERRAGFWGVTALQLSDNNSEPGPSVLVYRGWAPRDAQDPQQTPRVTHATGEVTIEGIAVPTLSNLLALSTDSFPGPLPAVWQNFDFAAFELASGLKVARFVIHQTEASSSEEGLTRKPLQLAAEVDRHYGYATQWFSLAILIAGLVFFFVWRQFKKHHTTP